VKLTADHARSNYPRLAKRLSVEQKLASGAGCAGTYILPQIVSIPSNEIAPFPIE
jgi:hypothetical protein